MKKILAATLALSLAACAPANTSVPEAAAPAPAATTMTTTVATTRSTALNPVGEYEFATQVNGEAVTGTIEITGTPGAYGGRIVTLKFPEFTVRSASAAGQELTVVAETPNGNVTFRMMFTGDTFTGGWTLGGDTGAITGRRTH
ncbi:hypothetical protein [Longimicrobium sp.]|jgi:hypothetical protein|uniref:hypothetical protein n=1 Tax=Longimicrobium sp. TaxID=2029185 RepID=UPI002F94EA30